MAAGDPVEVDAMDVEPANGVPKKRPSVGVLEIDSELRAKIDAACEKAEEKGLAAAVEDLLALERVHRLAAAAPETAAVCVAIIRLYRKRGDWKGLGEMVILLSKRRSQLKQAVTKTVQEAIGYLEETPDEETHLALLGMLRDVTSGKIYVELERARLTRMLAKIKEDKGDIAGAADIMQELQVETFGAMERREKFDFILEQVRLCLDKKDFVRAGIIANKIIPRQLDKEGFSDIKLRYYALMIRIHARNKNFLEICRAYLQRYHVEECQQAEKLWSRELRLAILFLILSPFDNLQSDLLANIRGYKKLEKLPALSALLKQLSTKELIRYPHLQETYGKELKTVVAMSEEETKGEELEWEPALQERITEHNLRVIANYYSRIGVLRLSQLLDLSEDQTERKLASMVSDKKALWARIDRPARIVTFTEPKSADTTVNQWVSSVSDLLDLVERTCHLVHKEVMLHKLQK